MANFWMVRAGEGGYLVEEFERQGCVAIGYTQVGDLSRLDGIDAIREQLRSAYPEMKAGAVGGTAGMLAKFKDSLQVGDRVISYDPPKREYLVGAILSGYDYDPELVSDYNHIRRVQWEGRVSRDDLSVSARNILGSLLAIFAPDMGVLAEIEAVLRGDRITDVDLSDEADDELEIVRRDQLDRAHEFIKDKILALSPSDMEELTAAILRAMGYKARVTPIGPDRDRDVIASPDGLGFQQPRIKAEVKHRPKHSIGAPGIRGFIGGLRAGDSGLYVSTGGYSKEAFYEAERASIPVTLVDLDDLASLVVEHYDQFDSDGRSLVPLLRVYWPAS